MFRLESPWWLKALLMLIALPSLLYATHLSAWLIAALVAGTLAALVRTYIGGGQE